MLVEKFRVKTLYEKLNRDQQRILRACYMKRFDVSIQQFYNVLNGAEWTADHLIFFADLFDCSPRELYVTPPEVHRRLADLEKEKDELQKKRKKQILSKIGLS